MRVWLISLLVTLLALSACSADRALSLQEKAAVCALYGSDLGLLSTARTANGLSLTVSSVPPAGLFLRVDPPSGLGLAAAEWQGVDSALGLAVGSEQGIDVGIVPVAGYNESPVEVSLTWGPAIKRVSIPPLGSANLLIDLSLLDLGGGEVQLSWTQTNVGDYDTNGEVNIADLAPLGMFFGRDTSGSTPLDTEYWVDGDHNGEINLADLSPIGAHFTARVAGYNIQQNGTLVSTVFSEEMPHRLFLPPLFEVTVPGLATDTWMVIPFDGDGAEGIATTLSQVIDPSDVDVNVSFSITGQQLLDLTDGLNPGPMDEGSSLMRIIDPIIIVDSMSIGTVTMTGVGSAQVTDLPRAQQLAVQLGYLPEIDLATGAIRSVTGLRKTSAVPDPILNTIIFELPVGTAAVDIVAAVDLSTVNPAGGFFTDLQTEVVIPGDNPATPEVETSYTLINHTRLDNKLGLVCRDTDFNADYEDEVWLEDDDLDCLSHRMREQELDEDQYDDDEHQELEISGTVTEFDEAAGTITLTGATLEAGELEIPLPEPLQLTFSESTEFIERIKQEGDDIDQDVDPSTFAAGDQVEIDLYRLDDADTVLPVKYWIEKIRREIDEEASPF